MSSGRQQKGAIALIVIGIIVLIGIGYLLFSSTALKTKKDGGLSSTTSTNQLLAIILYGQKLTRI